MFNKFYLTSMLLIMSMFFIMLSSSSIYIKWLMMEFSTIIMISLINFKSENKIISILYYIISTISGLFVIITISMNFTFFSIKYFNINNILMISMFMKLGFFPFWFWMIYIYNMSNWNQIFILSTMMKFIPIYFYSELIYMSMNIITFMFLNNIFISLYTNYNFNLKKLLACSSIFNSSYLFLMLYINKTMFLFLIMIYFINFSMLTYMMNYYKIENLEFNYIPYKMMNLIKLLLFSYSSFPLFLSFMFKWEFFLLMSNINMNNNLLMLMLLSNMLMIWNYFIIMKHMNLKFNKFLYKIEMKSPYIIYIIIIIIMYSLSFLLFNLI
nr:TPA_asm: ND2 [Bombus superbus]